jgi:transposase
MSSVPATSASTIWLGWDVHKASVTSAVLRDGATQAECVDRLPNTLPKLERYVRRWQREGEVRVVYEASCAGFVLQRACTAWGVACDVIAPSLIPTRPGVQRKHDRYDAVQLARLHRAGELTPVRVPAAAEERIRDLVRLRMTLQREVMRSRHYVLKFLTRRGCAYGAKAWTPAHHTWLATLLRETSPLEAEDRELLQEHLALLSYKEGRRTALDQRVAALAATPAYAPLVGRLGCFRGIDTLAAMVLATELGDWRRFASPRALMSYVGLVPREHSSGERERRGALTKAGNAHVRHVLVQAAWSYRHLPRVGKRHQQRQAGQPADVVAHAWKAQHRLYKRYHRLQDGHARQIAAVAVARELIGFLWAVMREEAPPQA